MTTQPTPAADELARVPFAKGQMLRCVCRDAPWLIYGKEYISLGLTSDGFVQIRDDDGDVTDCHKHRFEPVQLPQSPAVEGKGCAFKVGDRVRHVLTEDVGVLLIVDGRDSYARWDGSTRQATGCWLENLEHAEATPQPEQAKAAAVYTSTPPRSGKSAFQEKLAAAARARGEQIAVLRPEREYRTNIEGEWRRWDSDAYHGIPTSNLDERIAAAREVLAKEMRREVGPRFPHEGRSDRAMPRSNGR